MAEHSRYNVSDAKAGIENGILKNKLYITDQKELDDAETLLLSDTYTHYFEKIEHSDILFDLSFLFEIHEYFLGTLYSWAGKKRQLNISKDNTMFAPAEYLDNSLLEFEQILKKNIPETKDLKPQIVKKLAFIHNELNVLHPFREGNGRTIRLFLDLIVAQLGYQPIDWGKTEHGNYIKACKDGLTTNHLAMEKIISKGLFKTPS